jgi:hypothetical protein
MANVVFNIAKGRVAELHERVNNNDPTNSALILVPLETTGLVSDATLIDYDTLDALLAGASNEQTTMGRKTFTDADLAAFTANDTSDRSECALPTVTYTAASGNAISKFLICYDGDTTGGTDANIIPLVAFDFVYTPSGIDLVFAAGDYFRAS